MNNHELTINQTILLTIKRTGINGEGIGYYKRLAVFVPDAIVGEVVEVKITKVEEKYAYGEITKIKSQSEHRITPKCKYYGKCGGCSMQHMTYEFQLEQKFNLVVESFERYYDGNINKIKFLPIIGMENPWAYRNKSALPVRHDGDKVVVGMYARGSNKLVYIDKSLVENKLITDTIQSTLKILTDRNVDVYNPKFHQGSLRYLVVRGFEETNEVQVTFVLFKEDKKLIKVLNEVLNLEHVESVNYNINSDSKSIEIISGEVIHVGGKKQIQGKLGRLLFNISPDSFFQLNTKQTTVLYDEVKKAGKFTGKEKVLDLYCGIGSIGLYIADEVAEVRGIDNNEAAIENAKEFARMNNIENAKFYYGNILPHLNNFEEKGFVPDVLVIDPPRRGMELNILNYLQKSKIKKVIYVSCNPSTLVKNLNHLQKNYVIRYVQPVDMFPQTAAVEAVCLLERR